jgi:hypothetical protein
MVTALGSCVKWPLLHTSQPHEGDDLDDKATPKPGQSGFVDFLWCLSIGKRLGSMADTC